MRSRTQNTNGLMGLYKPISPLAYKFIGLSLCLAFLLCWAMVSEAKIIESILVIVNDDIITQTEFAERLGKEKEILKMLYQFDEARLSEEIEKRKPKILNTMINELLFLQEAVRMRLEVSDSEIQKFVTSLVKQYGSQKALQEALKAQGYTEDTFRKERKRALLRQKLVDREFGKELDVSDDEVRQFYRENRDEFPGRSDVVKLKHIFIKFQTKEADRDISLNRAKDVLESIRDGADFGEMAKKFSDHAPTKASGGDIDYFRPGMGQQDHRLEAAAAKLAVGEISDIIETPGGYDIIKIIDIRDNAIKMQRIYIAVWPDASSEKAAEEKADLILEELKNGADFVDLVGKYSDDPLTVNKAGDWKEIPVGTMTPELLKAFDSFDDGEISRPVKTPVGLHIFKIDSRQDLTDDEMDQLREFLSNERLKKKLDDYSEKLRERTFIKTLAED